MANVRRYGDPSAKCADCGLWGGQALEEPEGKYVTHVDYVAREAELVGRIVRLREAMLARTREILPLPEWWINDALADDDAASGGEVASDGIR